MEPKEHPHLTRQLEIIPVDVLDIPIHFIGVGAVGSLAALSVAKMGFNNITAFDDDDIEIENMNCQFYRHEDVDKKKVVALKELIKTFTGEDITIHPERYEAGAPPLPGIVVASVDSMAVRKTIWEAHTVDHATATQLVIDPRMGAETALCYAMRPLDDGDCESYPNSLYSDEEAVHERCTAKATMYTAMLLAGHVAPVIKAHACGKPYPPTMQWAIADFAFQARPLRDA